MTLKCILELQMCLTLMLVPFLSFKRTSGCVNIVLFGQYCMLSYAPFCTTSDTSTNGQMEQKHKQRKEIQANSFLSLKHTKGRIYTVSWSLLCMGSSWLPSRQIACYGIFSKHKKFAFFGSKNCCCCCNLYKIIQISPLSSI